LIGQQKLSLNKLQLIINYISYFHCYYIRNCSEESTFFCPIHFSRVYWIKYGNNISLGNTTSSI